ncbi:MAG: DUF1631 domain-containing protein [Marinobacter sp.]|nr:DUF1631 domain-containing protein [Marinobacter sp.]
MTNPRNVISLNSAAATGMRSLPSALVRLRDQSAQSLKGLLGEFFDRADDALFELADRSQVGPEQAIYFDAMRELRLRRKQMTLSVLQWVGRAFNELGNFDPCKGSGNLEQVDSNTLTLMDNSDLEQTVAIDNLVMKLRGRYGEHIELLAFRISHLMKGVVLEARQCPLSPEVICHGLGEACKDLDIDIRAKLVVLKLFDRLLIQALEPLYEAANASLIAEGVLPTVRRPSQAHAAQRPVERRAAPSAAAASRASADDAGAAGPGFSELTALLRGSQSASAAGFVEAGRARDVATPELMTRLSGLQASPDLITAAGDDRIVPLHELLGQVFERSAGGLLEKPKQVDADVINLVSMLFDFILEDRQLPPAIKCQISRLQIPVLKVALLDRSFFNRGGHPARKLLNELAMAGIGWVDGGQGQKDPLQAKIIHVVDRLLNEFSDNVELFAELLEEFSHFMDLDRRRRELVEQRLRDAEEGRAKHDQAAQRVNTAIETALAEHGEIPDVVLNLVEQPLRKVMEWVCLREGPDSPVWSEVSDLLTRLLWTVDPGQGDGETRDELLRQIPLVTDRLRDHLQAIAWDPFEINRILHDLELIHVDTLQGLMVVAEAPAKVAVEAPVVPEQKIAEAAPEVSPAEALTPEFEAIPDVEPPQAEVPVSALEPEVLAPEVAAGIPVDVAASSVETLAPELQPWLERADSLRVGSWLEMSGEQRIRCKLAAFIKATGKYVFVNRNGTKVAEYHREELAKALAEERLVMLDDGLIFDRALESIIDNLRHNRKD